MKLKDRIRPVLRSAHTAISFTTQTLLAAAFWLCFAQTLELFKGDVTMPHFYRGPGSSIVFGASAAFFFTMMFVVAHRLSTGARNEDLNVLLAFVAGMVMAPALYVLIVFGPAEAAFIGLFSVAGALIIAICCIPFILLMYVGGVR